MSINYQQEKESFLEALKSSDIFNGYREKFFSLSDHSFLETIEIPDMSETHITVFKPDDEGILSTVEKEYIQTDIMGQLVNEQTGRTDIEYLEKLLKNLIKVETMIYKFLIVLQIIQKYTKSADLPDLFPFDQSINKFFTDFDTRYSEHDIADFFKILFKDILFPFYSNRLNIIKILKKELKEKIEKMMKEESGKKGEAIIGDSFDFSSDLDFSQILQEGKEEKFKLPQDSVEGIDIPDPIISLLQVLQSFQDFARQHTPNIKGKMDILKRCILKEVPHEMLPPEMLPPEMLEEHLETSMHNLDVTPKKGSVEDITDRVREIKEKTDFTLSPISPGGGSKKRKGSKRKGSKMKKSKRKGSKMKKSKRKGSKRKS